MARVGRRWLSAAAAAVILGLAACGGDGGNISADDIANCLRQAGYEPSVGQGGPAGTIYEDVDIIRVETGTILTLIEVTGSPEDAQEVVRAERAVDRSRRKLLSDVVERDRFARENVALGIDRKLPAGKRSEIEACVAS